MIFRTILWVNDIIPPLQNNVNAHSFPKPPWALLNWRFMCGRYRLTARERYIRDHFGLEDDVSWTPRWNIAPTQQIPIVRQDNKQPKRTFGLVRWGLIGARQDLLHEIPIIVV